jgi:hypothetical protein
MTTAYRAIIQIGEAHPDFVSVTMQTGTRTTVDGEPMVRTVNGFIWPADDWSDTEADAYAEAARVIDARGSALCARASVLAAKAEALLKAEVA